uniref:Uncharacterized protein n=1 Tax=Eutreptiella gymnastica TaxID=73025 RepID=A0A7S1J247_9EUGL
MPEGVAHQCVPVSKDHSLRPSSVAMWPDQEQMGLGLCSLGCTWHPFCQAAFLSTPLRWLLVFYDEADDAPCPTSNQNPLAHTQASDLLLNLHRISLRHLASLCSV